MDTLTSLIVFVSRLNFKTMFHYAALGAGVGFMLLATFFLLLMGRGEALGMEMTVPLATITLAGAGGGACYYLVQHLWNVQGWKKVMVIVMSIAMYGVILWLGLVGGLNLIGLWD